MAKVRILRRENKLWSARNGYAAFGSRRLEDGDAKKYSLLERKLAKVSKFERGHRVVPFLEALKSGFSGFSGESVENSSLLEKDLVEVYGIPTFVCEKSKDILKGPILYKGKVYYQIKDKINPNLVISILKYRVRHPSKMLTKKKKWIRKTSDNLAESDVRGEIGEKNWRTLREFPNGEDEEFDESFADDVM